MDSSELRLASLVVPYELYLYSDGLDARGLGIELLTAFELNQTALVSRRRGICSEVVHLFKKQNGALLLLSKRGSIIALSDARPLLSCPSILWGMSMMSLVLALLRRVPGQLCSSDASSFSLPFGFCCVRSECAYKPYFQPNVKSKDT